MSVFKDIKRELQFNYFIEHELSVLKVFKLIIRPRGFALTLIRFALLGSRIARLILQIFFHIEVGANVTIGANVFIPHPYAIVIAEGTKIGDYCVVYHRTTFAEKGGIHKGPFVGNNCVIGTGCVLIGNITIHDNVKIGPNSVVIKDIQANSLAFGNPIQLKPLT